MHDQPNRPDFQRLENAAEQWAQIVDDAFVLGRVSAIDALRADEDALRATANAARAAALNGESKAAHIAESIDWLLDGLAKLEIDAE